MTIVTTQAQPVKAIGIKQLISRHPLIAFFAIAFVGEWFVTLPLVLAQNGLSVLPYTVPALGPVPPAYWFAVLAAIAGPTLASFTVTAMTGGKAEVRQLLRRYMLWRVWIRWYLLVLVGVPLLQLAFSSLLLGIAPLRILIQQWPLYFTTFLPNVLLIAVVVQLWEEGGWSGYAIPALQRRFGAWRAALIFGPLWALFHMPFFFVPGQIFDQKVGVVTMIVQMVLMIIVAVPTRIIMNWVFNNTKASILIAILLHAALDASNSGSAYITHLLPASQLGGYGLASALIFPFVAAVLLLIFTKGRLSYKREQAPQLTEAAQATELSL